MAVRFTKPASSAPVDLNRAVTFAGTADAPVAKVLLVADDQFELASVPVADGIWTFDRAFSSPGDRKITALGIDGQANTVAQAVVRVVVRPPVTGCAPRELLFAIGVQKPVPVFKLEGDSALFFRAGMTIDADGSPHAYHPNGKSGLDALQNAMNGTKFVGVVTDAAGKPVIQGPGDPAPGFYVSPTTLADTTIKDRKNPLRYVDSETVPYIALSGAADMQSRVTLGDFVAVYNGAKEKLCFGIFADVGPKKRLGEASIAMAKALGIPSSPRVGGEEKHRIFYVVFPGSRKEFGQAWTRHETLAVINEQAGRLFELWGGLARVKACFGDLA